MGIPFGRYDLIRKIAAGGMGQVLLARKGAEGFEKLVVIKRILPHLVEDEEFFTMFIDEAKITMRLDHPNIARINEFGSENNVHYIEMEYVAGEDLRRLEKLCQATNTQIPLGVILRVIADAAAGLDFAHKAKDSKGTPLNLVHRDVSPQNILIGFDGAVKLIDFGVAKAMGRAQHTATGILKGKFPYMSPEQAEGLDLDPRSDVFALGIVLWEQLTGRRLFKGENDLATQRLVKACVVEPPSKWNPALPAGLDAVVLKSLAKLPQDRYADAGEFRMALEEFALKNSIPASSAHLSSFMQSLYSERIAREQDPKTLEEDSGLTAMDMGGPVSHDAKTAGQRGVQVGNVAKPKRSNAPLILGAVALLAAVGGGVWFATRPTETVVVPQPIHPQPVAPTVVKAAEPKVEPLVLALTSEPEGAEVEIGGEKKGLTPLEVRLEVAKLPTLLKLSYDGYEVHQSTLTASVGPSLTIELKKKPKVVQQVAAPIKTQR